MTANEIELRTIHEDQANSNGWCGLTDVELAWKITCDLDNGHYFSAEDKEDVVYKIAKSLQKYRTF